MKRLIPVLAVAASVVALPFSHLALAKAKGPKGPPIKQNVCHITEVVEEGGNPVRAEGHVIRVARPAVTAHCSHHNYDFTGQDSAQLDNACPGDFCQDILKEDADDGGDPQKTCIPYDEEQPLNAECRAAE